MEELEPQSAGESPVETPAPPDAVSAEAAPDPAAVAPPARSAEEAATSEGKAEPAQGAAEPAQSVVSADELLAGAESPAPEPDAEDAHLKAVLEALVYVTEEPLTIAQISGALQLPESRIREVMDRLFAEFDRPDRGICIKEVAGGYKMATKPEHHDTVRNFARSLKPPLKLSLPALETLAVIAYKQPVTGPEIMEIRGVQGGGVMKTLLDRKLIAVAGRKNVIGKPMLYKTTREFLLQFGLKDLSELPSLKEFEEIRRMAFSDEPPARETVAAQSEVEPAPAGPASAAAPADPGVESAPAEREVHRAGDDPPSGAETGTAPADTEPPGAAATAGMEAEPPHAVEPEPPAGEADSELETAAAAGPESRPVEPEPPAEEPKA